MPQPTLHRSRQKLADSAEKIKDSTYRVEDSAERTTQLAADRTVFAAERTYAAWVRTGLLAMASGKGGHGPDQNLALQQSRPAPVEQLVHHAQLES